MPCVTDPADVFNGLTDNFNDALGAQFDEIGADRVVMRCPVKPLLLQPYGIVHGGVYCALVETAASVGGAVWFGDRGRVVGVSNHTNFLRATREGELVATATPVQRGRTQQLWRVEITEGGELVATGELRIANLPNRPATTGVA